MVQTVAPSDSTVLLLGETGTGKELIARAIRDHSRRKDRAFVKLNCAAIPTGLLESELFGHEKGAFTGAIARRSAASNWPIRARCSSTKSAIIPLEIQPKLLRALQEREFERLGSTQTRKVNLRLIAATNRDLESNGRRPRVSQRSLLSPERLPDSRPAAARAPRGHSPAGALFRAKIRPANAKAHRNHSIRGAEKAHRRRTGPATFANSKISSSAP